MTSVALNSASRPTQHVLSGSNLWLHTVPVDDGRRYGRRALVTSASSVLHVKSVRFLVFVFLNTSCVVQTIRDKYPEMDNIYIRLPALQDMNPNILTRMQRTLSKVFIWSLPILITFVLYVVISVTLQQNKKTCRRPTSPWNLFRPISCICYVSDLQRKSRLGFLKF